MRNKFLIIGLAMSSLSFGQTKVDSTCVGITSKGNICKIKVNIDSTKHCHWHIKNVDNFNNKVKSTICGENTKKNTPCQLKTRHSSEKCHHHRD